MERNLVTEIKDLQNKMKKYIMNDLDPIKMFNMTQLQILTQLYKNEDKDICQKEFEENTHVKKASITGAIDSLIDKGLVYRQQAKDDKRKNFVKLTDKALNYKKDFKSREIVLRDKVLENISKEDLEAFYRVVDTIKENIEEIR